MFGCICLWWGLKVTRNRCWRGVLKLLGLLHWSLLTIGGAVVDQRSLSWALLGIVAKRVPLSVFSPFLAFRHGVAMLATTLA